MRLIDADELIAWFEDEALVYGWNPKKMKITLEALKRSVGLMPTIPIASPGVAGTINAKLDNGAYLPTRAHKTDAGLDMRAFESGAVEPHGSRTFGTGVHIQLPPGTAGLLVSKSGLNVKSNITSTGLIDEGYTGEIKVKLYNHGDELHWVKAGDKISQLVIIPVLTPELHLTDHLDESDRGDSGFGSTGR